MCYVIQRTDVESFQPSIIDPLYREAFKEAIAGGWKLLQWLCNGRRTVNPILLEMIYL